MLSFVIYVHGTLAHAWRRSRGSSRPVVRHRLNATPTRATYITCLCSKRETAQRRRVLVAVARPPCAVAPRGIKVSAHQPVRLWHTRRCAWCAWCAWYGVGHQGWYMPLAVGARRVFVARVALLVRTAVREGQPAPPTPMRGVAC